MMHCSQHFRSPTPASPERRINGPSESLVGLVFSDVQKSNAIFLKDEDARRKAKGFSKVMERWNGPKLAADVLYAKFAK